MAMKLYELVGADPERPFSPHCWKARMALAHKGLEAECIPVRFTEVASVEGGFHGLVPVLVDGDTRVGDSFAIAEYLDRAYPDAPSLFGGETGRAHARFIEKWSQLTIHSFLGTALLMDIHDALDADDKHHFRTTREPRFGKTLEEVPVGRDDRKASFLKSLEPLRQTLAIQPFIGGNGPSFADYIVFGAFQWARAISSYEILPPDDAVAAWDERCLDLHGGLGRTLRRAA